VGALPVVGAWAMIIVSVLLIVAALLIGWDGWQAYQRYSQVPPAKPARARAGD